MDIKKFFFLFGSTIYLPWDYYDSKKRFPGILVTKTRRHKSYGKLMEMEELFPRFIIFCSILPCKYVNQLHFRVGSSILKLSEILGYFSTPNSFVLWRKWRDRSDRWINRQLPAFGGNIILFKAFMNGNLVAVFRFLRHRRNL